MWAHTAAMSVQLLPEFPQEKRFKNLHSYLSFFFSVTANSPLLGAQFSVSWLEDLVALRKSLRNQSVKGLSKMFCSGLVHGLTVENPLTSLSSN